MANETPSRRNPPHGGDGKFIATPDTAERDAAAARLRATGMTYDQIATKLEFSSRGHAYNAVDRALKSIRREPAEELRSLMLAQLDEIQVVAREIMLGKHYLVSGGKVVYDPLSQTPTPLLDDGPRMAAMGRLMDVMNRRAKLLGLDAAVKVQTLTLEEIQAQIAAAEAEVEALERQGGDPS